MIKMVVSDMDGTLLNKQSCISSKNLKAIHMLKEKGIEFAIASGRNYQGVHAILEQYHLECEAILGNGAQYCDFQGHIMMSCYLNKSVYKDIVKIFEDAHIPYIVFTTQGFYCGYQGDYVQQAFIERARLRFGTDASEFFDGGRMSHSPCRQLQYIEDVDAFLRQDLEIIKVEAFSLCIEDIVAAKALLKNIPTISYLSSFVDNVEVTDEKAQKGLILEKVISLKGYRKNEVAVLGDGMNDLTLFECFPYSFAMNNGEEEMKMKAYRIVGDCEDDGFSEAIMHILKID